MCPDLSQFRVERQDNGLVHLVFDCPDKSMNVFSNKAIHELGQFAEWLHGAEVRGVLIRSGKASGFCAGADLTELGVAYDMIVAAPPADRFDIAYDHFFPLSHAIRRLESAGKPVAAAIAGVALGGGCELALGAHYRVLTDSKRAMLGLPECAVGLLPGAGGTQRMPRLVGVDAGLEVLLLGRTFQGDAAVRAGLADEVVSEGDEVGAAERWLLSEAAHAIQPWDRPGASPLAHAAFADAIDRHRTRELERMLGHEPAPLAILDCVELGLMQPIDGAIRSEMSVFARLIQRRESRNMIRTMFLGKQVWDKDERAGSADSTVVAVASAVSAMVRDQVSVMPELRKAGFMGRMDAVSPVQARPAEGYWLEDQAALSATVHALAGRIAPLVEDLNEAQILRLDHLVCRDETVPSYLGGISGLLALSERQSA